MKKIILLIIIISSIAKAQDIEPTQQRFVIGGDTLYLSADSSYFKQSNFILGWAWSCGRKMSEAMFDNQAHVGSGYVLHPVFLTER